MEERKVCMDKEQQMNYWNVDTPSLINICVDKNGDGEFEGRIYDCYHEEPGQFENLIQLLYWMEDLYENLGFPQASTRSRFFYSPREVAPEDLKRVDAPEKLFDKRGEKGSFAVWVRTRQNATWQGEIIWMEKDKRFAFASVLDLVKIIDNILTSED